MKFKYFLLVSLSISIISSSNLMFCSEPQQTPSLQDYLNRFLSYFSAQPKEEKTAHQKWVEREAWKKKKSDIVTGAGVAGALATAPSLPLVAAGYTTRSLMEKLSNMLPREIQYKISLPIGLSLFLGSSIVYTYLMVKLIRIIFDKRISKLERIDLIQKDLRVLLNNDLLYPDYSSKIHVLMKKDEFAQYVNLFIEDSEGIFNDACSELIEELNTAYRSVSKEDKEKDKEIQKYIMLLKGLIAHLPLEEQITELEEMYYKSPAVMPKSVQQMQGYVSLYYRLKNQFKIEQDALTQDQKKKLYEWKLKAQELYTREPVKMRGMTEEEKENYLEKQRAKKPFGMTPQEAEEYREKGDILRQDAKTKQEALDVIVRKRQETAQQEANQ